MAAFSLTTLQLHKSHLLTQTHLSKTSSSSPFPKIPKPHTLKFRITAKFNLFEILGGRGLLKGEVGLDQELKKTITTTQDQPPPPQIPTEDPQQSASATAEIIPEDGFDKELMGLTGGFPGGEKGLQKFIEKNPPPKKAQKPTAQEQAAIEFNRSLKKKPKAPELPLLMPGMIAIVKNESNPYYMYCGIVQRITDGKAGVLFEGGNWDRLITFELNELERREKGPPMVNPRSAVLEALMTEKDS
ncbi:hypothetical protein Vadar_003914 [Vaccinium darrowii]|uniref:Uncharacterized protein n=1 Tax=Vaccinium darrowii TaxID=229202 RepID=A0ACB7XFN5_9ERIC|nr:hypothetical protein Vadar_003914 [Vaccinium darrowii]